MHSGTSEFRVLGIVYTVLHLKNTCTYITYSVVFELQKTRSWSPTPLSKYPNVNSGSGQMDDFSDHHKY